MNTSQVENEGPLSGFRIVDLSQVLSGPAATMLLADQGAEVIKVESLHGDITRKLGTGSGGMSTFFLNINRGKRAICVDIKTPEGGEVVRRLIKTGDVLIQNFRPGVMEKLGLGYDDVRAIREDIVYVSISGFGNNGPYANKRVYDPVIQALSGLTELQADCDDPRPRMVRTVIPDKTTALTAAQAITAALLSRTRTGSGRHVEIAMLDATIAYLWPEGMVNQTLVDDDREIGFGQPIQELIFKSLDGYITTGAMSDQEWHGLCQALEKPEWVDDPRYKTTQLRFENVAERLAATAEILATKTNEQWLERLDQFSVPCAPVLSRTEMLTHPQVVANDIIRQYDQPGLGQVRQPRSAAKFHGLHSAEAPLAPMLGQHNAEVLLELGYTQAKIEQFRRTKVIGNQS
jgi:crotonobetainyl-CoA:carnitine CoA-transferase CaiB-like acyl-CoA transferase